MDGRRCRSPESDPGGVPFAVLAMPIERVVRVTLCEPKLKEKDMVQDERVTESRKYLELFTLYCYGLFLLGSFNGPEEKSMWFRGM